MTWFSVNINKTPYRINVQGDMPLLWVLRDKLQLTGTKYGCGKGLCGSCTVHIEGEAVRTCVYPISELGEKSVTTIEGLDPKNEHPLQVSWIDNDVPQCGYCQAGQIMTAAALLNQTPNPTKNDIIVHMSNNLCRCGTYQRINKAILQTINRTSKTNSGE